ncbi:MAG: hypothetical protein J0M24_02045 [Verrucomicrobia bacterium]|jgi:hypothetical protein|nr:hypothetical protein [Verrucomicrobiota bacterium]
MTNAIQLERDETIQSVEHHHATLQAATGDLQMWIPTDIPERIGVDVSILQLLMTWSQKQTVPSLRTRGMLLADADAGLSKLCDNVVGLSAVTLSKMISSWDQEDIRSQAHAKASQQVDEMVKECAKFQRGASFAVLCFDGTSKAHPRNLYYANGDVLSERDLKLLFTKRLKLAEPNSARRERIEEVAMRLATILFETFRNTHQWARTTVDGVPIRRGVRGLLMRRYRQHPASTGSALRDRHEQDAPLANFLANYLDHTASGGMLELSVFDGGPGLVRRLRGTSDLTSLSLEDERATCFECFNKHKTSSGVPHRGIGLYASMRELNKLGGFLRLRTGRLSLYRSFHEDPFREGEPASFADWPIQDGHPYADVAGTVLTFLIPIPEEQP